MDRNGHPTGNNRKETDLGTHFDNFRKN